MPPDRQRLPAPTWTPSVHALFDAVVALLGIASASAPVGAGSRRSTWRPSPPPSLRHLLRSESTPCADRRDVPQHRPRPLPPLGGDAADLHRDELRESPSSSTGSTRTTSPPTSPRQSYDDEELGRALASVTGGNPLLIIEALRHVDEAAGRWDPSTLPQGVREAVSRRLRLRAETNKALAAARSSAAGSRSTWSSVWSEKTSSTHRRGVEGWHRHRRTGRSIPVPPPSSDSRCRRAASDGVCGCTSSDRPPASKTEQGD